LENSKLIIQIAQLGLGICLGSVIACSPTKFYPAVSPTSVCDPSLTVCEATESGQTKIVQNFKVGAGKVDILFVVDNSASMAVIQDKLANRFSGFIQNLDAKETNYQIAITTTDLAAVQASPLITFDNGATILNSSHADRVTLFGKAIARKETRDCEAFIKSAYYTYGFGFQEAPYYLANYESNCPTGDTRGTATALEVITQNPSGFIRSDAHLSIILVSNDEVRGGRQIDPNVDTASNFLAQITNIKIMESKFFNFNSIVTLDAACGTQQSLAFKDVNGITIRDQSGNPVIRANPGAQYVALSSSASTDVDGNAKPRGLTKSICEGDYGNLFNDIATNITESARLLSLKCTPISAPKVTLQSNSEQTVPFLWQGTQILFQKGSEGVDIKVEYTCDVGVVK
jgi:hypothetical protein